MKQHTTLIILTFLISSCCCSYDKKDFDFNSEELRHFSDYKIGDTIYYQSNLGDIDTINIVGFKTEVFENCCGFMAPKPLNWKSVQIKHLPFDNWHGTSQNMRTGGKVKILYQDLFLISKFPTDKKTEYRISFKDFDSIYDTLIGEYHSDTITLNDLKVSSYYIVKHGYPERVIDPKNIETVYWTDKFGLTAYKSKDGETWTKKSSH